MCIAVVHGERIVKLVEKGISLAACYSPHLDILAHPSPPSPEETKLELPMASSQELVTKRSLPYQWIYRLFSPANRS